MYVFKTVCQSDLLRSTPAELIMDLTADIKAYLLEN